MVSKLFTWSSWIRSTDPPTAQDAQHEELRSSCEPWTQTLELGPGGTRTGGAQAAEPAEAFAAAGFPTPAPRDVRKHTAHSKPRRSGEPNFADAGADADARNQLLSAHAEEVAGRGGFTDEVPPLAAAVPNTTGRIGSPSPSLPRAFVGDDVRAVQIAVQFVQFHNLRRESADHENSRSV